jgi:hypothetical protein
MHVASTIAFQTHSSQTPVTDIGLGGGHARKTVALASSAMIRGTCTINGTKTSRQMVGSTDYCYAGMKRSWLRKAIGN